MHPECTTPTVHEEWRPVVGYEGTYSVSSLGRIRRDLGSAGTRAGRILKPSLKKTGYLYVDLSSYGVVRSLRLHVLVAAAFIGPRPDDRAVNHQDGQKANCAASNLEYVTHSENQRHAVNMGLKEAGDAHWSRRMPERCARGATHGNAKLTDDNVRQIRRMLDEGNMTQRAIARHFGVYETLISKIKHGEGWRHVR